MNLGHGPAGVGIVRVQRAGRTIGVLARDIARERARDIVASATRRITLQDGVITILGDAAQARLDDDIRREW